MIKLVYLQGTNFHDLFMGDMPDSCAKDCLARGRRSLGQSRPARHISRRVWARNASNALPFVTSSTKGHGSVRYGQCSRRARLRVRLCPGNNKRDRDKSPRALLLNPQELLCQRKNHTFFSEKPGKPFPVAATLSGSHLTE